jgi:hypothetical protein
MQCILYKIYFWKGFSDVLQIDMHLICTPMLVKFYSYKKWVLQEVPKQEPMMEAEEGPQELPQAAPAPPIFPQPNLYELLMQDIIKNSPMRVESQGSSLSAQE